MYCLRLQRNINLLKSFKYGNLIFNIKSKLTACRLCFLKNMFGKEDDEEVWGCGYENITSIAIAIRITHLPFLGLHCAACAVLNAVRWSKRTKTSYLLVGYDSTGCCFTTTLSTSAFIRIFTSG